MTLSIPTLRLRVTNAAQTTLRGGHPWLFADSIRAQNRDGETGELAVVFDRNDRFLAVGLFDAESPIRLRVLHSGKPQIIDSGWWERRLAAAWQRREPLFDDQTNGYRCINGESDGWPGFVLDRYDQTLVIKLYTAAWFAWLERVIELIRRKVPHERVVLRLSRNIASAAAKFGLAGSQVVAGSPLDGPVIFRENRLKFEADVLRGQKTGFFLDQRENRAMVESLSRDRHVLNAFSFSGGFSLYAARGAAASVCSIDISAHALAAARRNFLLNRENHAISGCRHEMVQADAFEWLRSARPDKFDLVVLDPPSLAKREAERTEAIRAYGRLVGDAIERLARGGILVAASCSAHVSTGEFFDAATAAAKRSGRQWVELLRTFHPADHPATFKEGEYLKCLHLRFEP